MSSRSFVVGLDEQLIARITMPYATNADLPPPVRNHLDDHAQSIYRESFNHAWLEYAREGRREEIAHRVAWAAVKRQYKKIDSHWVRK